MHIVITGGAGFLGQRLARTLLQRGTLAGPDGRAATFERLTLVDMTAPNAFGDPRVDALTGDISHRDLIEQAIDGQTSSIFHLAAVVSGQAEADFDLGMRVNLDATRQILETCRARGRRPRLVFASSVAVYGGNLPDVALETTAVTPQTSYGAEKAIGELLVSDYARRGFVDGRSVRLPTISVRPGRPNAAASSFASSLFREPLNGEVSICPIDPAMRVVLASPSVAIDSFIAAHDLPADRLGMHRTLNVPSLSVTVGEMVSALTRVAGAEVASRIRWEPNDAIARMVAGWPGAVDASRARALGFPSDQSLDALIQQYIDERQP